MKVYYMSNKLYEMNFSTSCPVLFGMGAAEKVGEKIKELGSNKIFLVCDKGVKSTGLVDKIQDYLKTEKLDVVLFDGVQSDPPDTMIDEAGNIMKSTKCDGIVSIGGGSTMDTGKALMVLSTNEGSITDYCLDPMAERKEGIPLILLPTTSGTGSEVSAGAVITVTSLGIKAGIGGVLPSLAIIDPTLCAGMPPYITATTGMDTLAHAIEELLSAQNNLKVEILAERAVELVFKSLKKAVENGSDMEARSDMCIAAYLGGLGLSEVFMPFGHAIAHTIGAKYHIAHGEICAVVTPSTVKFLGPHYPKKIQIIANAMGLKFSSDLENDELAKLIADRITGFRKELGLKNLKELGVTEADLDIISEDSLTDIQMIFAEYEPAKEDILKLLKEDYTA
jgi:alcohol dehydrogenase class IV